MIFEIVSSAWWLISPLVLLLGIIATTGVFADDQNNITITKVNDEIGSEEDEPTHR